MAVANDERISSISSLFLSEKVDQNSTSFVAAFSKDETGKEAAIAERSREQKLSITKEEDLDDIDKISSPGKPRAKPKSINSPGMLAQNINNTNMLLQSLSQKSAQVGVAS